MLLVALTGNIASGKSTVARLFAERGFPVVDADQLAREAVAPGASALAAIRARWGDGILDRDGALDRAALRRLVFGDAAQRRALEAIVHPEVARLRDLRLDDLRQRGAPIAILEIPLLFEAGLEGTVDRIVLVDAPREVRRARLVASRGLDAAEADAMLDAQADSATKRARAHHVIDNGGSPVTLGEQVDRVAAELEAAASA